MSGAPQFLPSQGLPGRAVRRLRPVHRPGRRARGEARRGARPHGGRALAADRPFVIDFRTDPAVPPIPPHASLDQIEAAASSIIQGDSDRAGMVRQGLKSKVQEALPGHRSREDRPGSGNG